MKKLNFNQNWIYYEGANGSVMGSLSGKAKDNGISVNLPHDASIGKKRNQQLVNGSGNGFFQRQTCHYLKTFDIGNEHYGKNIWLEFEGVYHNAFVYINNSFAGKCPNGYSNFYIDATPFIKYGDVNTIKVIVRNGVPSGRWYTGEGIYRNVSLMIADRMHFSCDGIHLTAMDVEEEYAVVAVEAELEYTGTGVRHVQMELKLLDKEGNVAGETQIPVTVKEHTKQRYKMNLGVENPLLWGVDSPHLYHYHAVIREGETILDEETGNFGIRKLQLDPKHGLRINGRQIKLKGGCIHNDNGIIGTVEFPHAEEMRIRALKEAGYNAVRSSHHPMSRTLLDICDRYGMLVMDEYSDVWVNSKVDYDYSMYMTEWWEHDITNMVNKDYNHPCVIIYSIGNEIYETGNCMDVQWGKMLADKIRSLDSSRYVVNCLNLMLSVRDRMGEILAELREKGRTVDSVDGDQEINNMMNDFGDMLKYFVSTEIAGKVTEEAYAQVDISGYNYAAGRYAQDVEKYPNRIIVGSETFPRDLDINWELVEKYPNVLGDFSWTAWDYLGEVGIGDVTYGDKKGMNIYGDYPYKAAYCGDFNLIGDRRPISYWREIIWGGRTKPYIAVQPPEYHDVEHSMTNWGMTDAIRCWNWNGYEGKPVTVEIYTDAEEVELYVNDRKIERAVVGETKKCVVEIETVYIPGKLEAVAYKNGVETGRDQIITAQESRKLAIRVDREEIPADGSDIAFVEISLCDANGILNPGSVKAVTASLNGPGIILGFGSADPASEENYFDRTVNTFEGRLRAAIRGTGQKGEITVVFETEDGERVEAVIRAV